MFLSNLNAEIVARILLFRKSRHKPNLESTSKYGFSPDLRGKNGGVLSMRMQVILDSSFAQKLTRYRSEEFSYLTNAKVNAYNNLREQILGSLSTRDFETRTATGRENFVRQDRIVSQILILFISNGEKILNSLV